MYILTFVESAIGNNGNITFARKKNGFVAATNLGTTIFLLLQPKILLQKPNVLLIELNILLL